MIQASLSATSARPDEGGEPEERERHELDVVGVGEVLADEPHRADPVAVGAADAVGVVVGVVHADLEADRHDERQERESEVRLVDGGGGRGGADDDGGDGGGEGARAGAVDPLGRVAMGVVVSLAVLCEG